VGEILTCPKCRQRLWVGEMQIPLVTCPKCLARVVNPNARERPEDAAPLEYRTRPRWVVPVEEESDADIRNTAMWLSILAVGLFAGAILVAIVVGLNFMSLLMVGAGLIMAIVVGWMYRQVPKEKEPPPPYLQRVQRGGVTVFDYASIRQEGGTGAFFGGFVLAVGISFMTMLGTGIGRGAAGQAIAVIVLAAGIAALIFLVVRAASDPQRRGFYNGLVAGSILGATGCGPCAVMAVFQ
jgi:hypothetical protein